MDDKRIEQLKEMVVAGGGVWVGVQETVEPPALVLFTNPKNGVTLALYDDLITEERVRNKIARSDRAYGAATVRIFRDNYDELVRHLQSSLEILARENK